MMPRLALSLCALMGCSSETPVPLDQDDTSSVMVTTPGPTTQQPGSCQIDKPDNTVGLRLCTEQAYPGYTLFGPSLATETYLLDLNGEIVYVWESDWLPGETVYLEENGHLLRTARENGGTPFNAGGAGGRIQEIDWDGNVVWEFSFRDDEHLLHHDMTRLPSGNVVMIAWELKTEAEAEAWGRDPATVSDRGLWSTMLLEVDPSTDEIVWEWHLWDHVVQDFDPGLANFGVVSHHRELLDLNAGATTSADPDWNHANAVDYNADLDQLVLSSRNQDEFFIIDHSTTTQQASGHSGGAHGVGGDLLYRWGNPQNYGMGGEIDQQLFGQHDTEWIGGGLPGEGHLLLFNNGYGARDSAVFELELPLLPDGSYAWDQQALEPEGPMWLYSDPQGEFFSQFISGAQRLANGNTLICEGWPGRVFEVTAQGEKVWEYVNPATQSGIVRQGEIPQENRVFRAERYPVDHPAFVGHDLAPMGPLERYDEAG